jgi:hypothetical protein
MIYNSERMERADRYVDRGVSWVKTLNGMYASKIEDQGYPDQGDALAWKLKSEEKFGFVTIDVKEAHTWETGSRPPEKWGGLMLATAEQIHRTWFYIVINRDMSAMAWINMNNVHLDTIRRDIETKHPETGEKQMSVQIPFEHLHFVNLT